MTTNKFRENVERIERARITVTYSYKAGDIFSLYSAAMEAENAAMQLAEQLRQHVSEMVKETGMTKRYFDLEIPAFVARR